MRCVHFKGLQCAAFPERIPNDILRANHDHKTPYAGEKDGIRFTPRPDARREGELDTYSGVLPPHLARRTSPDPPPGPLPYSTRSAILPPMTNGTDRHATGHRQERDRPGLSVAEAADRLGITPDAVRARLHRGTLGGEKYAGTWRVWLSNTTTDRTTDRQTTGDRQDATGPRQGDLGAEADALRGHVEDLRADVAYLQNQLDQRSRELAAERERADILHREALSRIGALGPGGDAGADLPQTGGPTAPEGQGATIRSARGQAPGPWWRRVLGITR
jgi:hypothetical protein